MPISPNPRRNTKQSGPDADLKAEAFISKAGSPAEPAGKASQQAEPGAALKPIMIRFPQHVLAQIDREAKRLGITRTAFIVQSAAEKVARIERETR